MRKENYLEGWKAETANIFTWSPLGTMRLRLYFSLKRPVGVSHVYRGTVGLIV